MDTRLPPKKARSLVEMPRQSTRTKKGRSLLGTIGGVACVTEEEGKEKAMGLCQGKC